MSYNRKEKLRGNIEAIRTAFQLDVERRPPTDTEWELLSKYAGFGGLKCILQDANEISDAAKWNKSDLELFAPTVELRQLIHDFSKDDQGVCPLYGFIEIVGAVGILHAEARG